MQFLLSQHVSGTNMPITRSTISEYLPLLGGHTWKAAWIVPYWASWSEHCSEDVARHEHQISGKFRSFFFSEHCIPINPGYHYT
jgi:hypothetical protein